MHGRWRTRVLLALALPALLGSAWLLMDGGSSAASRTRLYYIAAEETIWDYAPGDTDLITGMPYHGVGAIVTSSAADRIGKRYKKAIFKEYTDSTFSALKPRPAAWAHLGMLGPLIRGEVGDTIRVVFRNKASRPYSMHPHGVIYNKDSEGAGYSDGTGGRDKADDGVPPGGTHVYLWPVPERAGPTEHEGSSTIWMYHSHVSDSKDVNAGLIGPMIITARGKAKPDGAPKDVDREIIVAFEEMDENVSWYFDENLKTYASDPSKVSMTDRLSFASLFYLGNLRETINGLSFGHTPMMTMNEGERVRWYVFANTNFEIHAPHWHGNVVIANHMRTDVVPLLPMGMLVADMTPDNPGTWLFHCHVAPHLEAGMQARFQVMPKNVAAKPRPGA